jgi:hypothetical protein
MIISRLMLSTALCNVMLNALRLSGVMMNVFILDVIMFIVMAPFMLIFWQKRAARRKKCSSNMRKFSAAVKMHNPEIIRFGNTNAIFVMKRAVICCLQLTQNNADVCEGVWASCQSYKTSDE